MGEAARREFVPTERRKPSERDGSLFYPSLSVSWKSLYILFPILLGEELLEDDDCFFDRLDHTGFFNEIGVVDEVGEQGDHDGADEEPLEPAHGRPGEVVDPVGIGHLKKRMEGAGDHADDEHHHAEDQHIGDDVDPLGRRVLGKDAAQLAIIAPGNRTWTGSTRQTFGEKFPVP